MKRRPQIEAIAEETCVPMSQKLIGTRNPRRILNVKETLWRLCPTGILNWAEVEADDVPVHVSRASKECVTVLATITPHMRKLPLVMLAADLNIGKGWYQSIEHLSVVVNGPWKRTQRHLVRP
jgi:hypothetical protein